MGSLRWSFPHSYKVLSADTSVMSGKGLIWRGLVHGRLEPSTRSWAIELSKPSSNIHKEMCQTNCKLSNLAHASGSKFFFCLSFSQHSQICRLLTICCHRLLKSWLNTYWVLFRNMGEAWPHTSPCSWWPARCALVRNGQRFAFLLLPRPLFTAEPLSLYLTYSHVGLLSQKIWRRGSRMGVKSESRLVPHSHAISAQPAHYDDQHLSSTKSMNRLYFLTCTN